MSEAEEARKLFSQPCSFICAAASPEQIPSTALPEAAFAGRSNAGKSSLINALTGRRHLARSSTTPGRTQQILFFNLAEKLMLVDLPGYGYAKAPKSDVAAWNELIHAYLQTRPNLRCVILLIDGRHGALANDQAMMDQLDRAAVSYQVVLTKADQLRPAEREPRRKQVEAVLTKHPAARPDVMVTSAEEKTGLSPLQTLLASFALS